ncbi:MAG: DNA primase, partial [Solirubrobacteraceae bacterium]
ACYLWESQEAQGAREYLLERGLHEETLREFRAGYAPDAWDRLTVVSRQAGFTDPELVGAGLSQPKRERPGELLDRFRARIMFPTSDARGRVLGFGARALGEGARGPKYLNTAEGELYHKRAVLYGIALARPVAAKAGRMVLVEGYTDVIALHQAGVRNAVGVMGTSLTREQVAELTRSVTVLELCLDADSAGQEAMVRAAKLCADSGLELRVVELPAGTDPADLIRSHGAPALEQRIAASVPYVVFEVRRLLARADLGSAEGKDRVIAALRPVLAPMPASVLHDELVREVAQALELPGVRVTTLLEQGGGRLGPGSRSVGMPSSSPSAAAQRPLAHAAVARGPRIERDLLAMCMAAPDAGAALLARIDPEELLTDDLMRRAARLLTTQLPASPEAPEDDPELEVVFADLIDRAARGRPVSADELEHARLVLERDRLTRAVSYLRTHGGPGLLALSLELQKVLDAIRAVVARLEGPG